MLTGGMHWLNDTLHFGPLDSHLSIRAADSNSTPWLSGGRALSGWTASREFSTSERSAYSVKLPRDIAPLYSEHEPLKALRHRGSVVGVQTQLRYPSPTAVDMSDLSTGFMFVNETAWLESDDYSVFYMTVNDEHLLPDWLRDSALGWETAWINVLPDAQWLSYYAPVRRASLEVSKHR